MTKFKSGDRVVVIGSSSTNQYYVPINTTGTILSTGLTPCFYVKMDDEVENKFYSYRNEKWEIIYETCAIMHKKELKLINS